MTEPAPAVPADDGRKRLVFISPRFLFPADEGGKIRTGDILRRMKNGAFHITLLSPRAPGWQRYQPDLDQICDVFAGWDAVEGSGVQQLRRVTALLGRLPVSVASDRSPAASKVVQAWLDGGQAGARPELVVVDFPHADIYHPEPYPVPSLLFTHNVEAEIFERHAEMAQSPPMRLVWRREAEKMAAFERRVLNKFDAVIGVSDRNAAVFGERYGVSSPRVIPTGVDLQRFPFQRPDPTVDDCDELVFTGSMGWRANIDAIRWMAEAVWPHLMARRPGIRLTVVGRDPPPDFVKEIERLGCAIRFTGFVDSIVPYVHAAAVYVMPIRVGSGTRIKTYEAIAMGRPIVSTTLGVEGLPLTPGEHFEPADDPAAFAQACARLIEDPKRRAALADTAYRYVADNFSSQAVASVFEQHCLDVCEGPGRTGPGGAAAARSGG